MKRCSVYLVICLVTQRLNHTIKCVLFEGVLVKKIVNTLGFKDIELREKISGKEYDISAIAKLGGRRLIGEAKARRENQAMPVITSFVGSLDHEDLPTDTLGLFISISDLASDAKDWLGKSRKRDRIEIIVGQQIFERLTQIGYPTVQQVKKWAESSLECGQVILIYSFPIMVIFSFKRWPDIMKHVLRHSVYTIPMVFVLKKEILDMT